MNIKSSQTLVEEAQKNIETLSPNEVKSLHEKKEITLIDVRDIRELWKDGTVENQNIFQEECLNFGWTQKAPTIKQIKLTILKRWFYFVLWVGALL